MVPDDHAVSCLSSPMVLFEALVLVLVEHLRGLLLVEHLRGLRTGDSGDDIGLGARARTRTWTPLPRWWRAVERPRRRPARQAARARTRTPRGLGSADSEPEPPYGPGPPRPILAGGQPSDPGPVGAASSSAGAESGRLGLARRPGANECHGEPLAAHPVTLSPTRKLLRCRSPSQTASVCHAAGLELRIRSDRVGRFTSWRPGLPAAGPGPLPRLLSPPPEPEEPGRS